MADRKEQRGDRGRKEGGTDSFTAHPTPIITTTLSQRLDHSDNSNSGINHFFPGSASYPGPTRSCPVLEPSPVTWSPLVGHSSGADVLGGFFLLVPLPVLSPALAGPWLCLYCTLGRCHPLVHHHNPAPCSFSQSQATMAQNSVQWNVPDSRVSTKLGHPTLIPGTHMVTGANGLSRGVL